MSRHEWNELLKNARAEQKVMSPMADAILQLVTQRRTVSFAELGRLDGFSGGDLQIGLSNDVISNVVLWSGLTQAAVDALDELRVARKIHPVPTTPLVYLIDGQMLKLPIVKSKRHYKKPHWLPMVFNPGPSPESLE
jgi:hypothetical protein